MKYSFTNEDAHKISETLGCKAKEFDNSWSWKLSNSKTQHSMVFTVYKEVKLSRNRIGGLLSVQTLYGYYELHGLTGYVIFEPDEVIFVNEDGNKVSCIIIGKECTCSMFSNISKSVIHADFTKLDPAVLLSAMQLSLTETVLSI